MYKTIRHGENSLQYKILPQNDDFRIEGKLSSAESSCSIAGTSRKTKAKNSRRRRSFFAYLGLIFVCTVIVGAVLIPFLVSAECLPSPTEWFLRTKAAWNRSIADGGDKGNAPLKPPTSNGKAGGTSQVPIANAGINVGKTVKIINKNGVEKIVLRLNQAIDGAAAPGAAADDGSAGTHAIITSANGAVGDAIESNMGGLNKSTDAATIAPTGTLQTEAATQNKGMQRTGMPLAFGGNDGYANNNNDVADGAMIQPQNNYVSEVRFDGADRAGKPLSDIGAPSMEVTTLNDPTDKNDLRTKQLASEQLSSDLVASGPSAQRMAAVSPVASQLGYSNKNSSGAQGAIPPTMLTRIMQVPLLKAAAKKPPIPPVLVKTSSQLVTSRTTTTTTTASIMEGANGVQPAGMDAPPQAGQGSTKKSNWIPSHWPYVHPSTYFQWIDYKAEDSVLLPALLGFALIAVILIVAVCLVARNKRTIVSSVRKRNRNDVEETSAEDNATLLNTSNLSDED